MKKALKTIVVGTILTVTINNFNGFAFADGLTVETCTTKTSNESQCRTCCDCLDVDAATRRSCRHACAARDFSLNSGFITVDAPSRLGPDGDYAAAINAGSEQACKEYCDGSDELACGDRHYCRDACNTASFMNSGPDHSQPSDNRGLPPEIVAACQGKREQAACQVGGTFTGTCHTLQNQLACVLSQENAPDDLKQQWDRLDRNHDGFLDVNEVRDDAEPGDHASGDKRPQKNRRNDGRGPGGQPGGHGGYSVDQAISDRAQLHTIAFDGLAFLTGEMACDTFLPPGKVADFCGFQYMRDVDINELGHNTSFVPRVADNVLYILTDMQKAQLIALAKEQEKLLADFATKRFPLIKAFYRQLTVDIPAGSQGLNREAVMQYTAKLYEIDGLLSYRRAEVLGGIVRSLTDTQKQYLSKMKFNDSSTWPKREGQIDKRSMPHAAHVAVMTYASEMFSWYAGNVEADVYFCPERHATYFGSFFMKDIPAMGDPNFTISTSLTGDSGEAFLRTLTEGQRKLVTGLVDQQRPDLKEIVGVRRQIATLLRNFMKQPAVDKDRVMALSRGYGELDGEISYFYAKAFAEVAGTLTVDQKKALMKLRNLDPQYTPKGAYLYSAPIDMPEIPNVDFLFARPAALQIKATPAATAGDGSFKLTSPAVADGGRLPTEYTGDGSSATLPLKWTGVPEGTKSFALIMHHVAPDQTKWYWILYDIPATTTRVPKNVRDVGTLGNNSVNGRRKYAPPHSKGPGDKTYIYTLYALSSPIKLDVEPAEVRRDVLLAAMENKMLASAQLRVVYARDAVSQASRPK